MLASRHACVIISSHQSLILRRIKEVYFMGTPLALEVMYRVQVPEGSTWKTTFHLLMDTCNSFSSMLVTLMQPNYPLTSGYRWFVHWKNEWTLLIISCIFSYILHISHRYGKLVTMRNLLWNGKNHGPWRNRKKDFTRFENFKHLHTTTSYSCLHGYCRSSFAKVTPSDWTLLTELDGSSTMTTIQLCIISILIIKSVSMELVLANHRRWEDQSSLIQISTHINLQLELS